MQASPAANLEVEMKFPVAGFAELRKRLRQRGARPASKRPLQEEDHYFNAPDRDFAQTDEALRLRRIGSTNRVTYKGPKCDAQTKTRTEIEIGLEEGDKAAEDYCQLLRSLGYRDVAVVRKKRTIFRLKEGGFPVEVCLDEVTNVGRFAEVEIVAPASKLNAARKVVLRLASDLGLSGSERRSYLQLLLEKHAKTS
jgi:adenylate cyclase class 2